MDNEQTHISFEKETDQHQGEIDFCSPFCQCQCCHVNIIGFDIASFQFISPEISTNIISRTNNLGRDFNDSLLQPPRV